MIFAVLTFAAAGMSVPGCDDRPRRRVQTSAGAPVPPGWVIMSAGEVRAAIADTDAAWSAYQAASPPAPTPVPPTAITAIDGSTWILSDTGRPVKQ